MTGLTIRCPGCDCQYLLPMSLLGERGARVRCPRCRQGFLVSLEGEVTNLSAAEFAARATHPDEPPGPSAPGPAAASPAHEHARAALDALIERAGPGLLEAARDQRLFRDHGPALLEAFDDYRRRAGRDAPPEAFRAEVRNRLGLELIPGTEAIR